MDTPRASAFSTSIRPALMLFLLLTLLTGFLYPLVVTGVAQLLFPRHAAGSLVTREGHAVGSRLIGQSFSDSKYFWSRPPRRSRTTQAPRPARTWDL
jgi:potassium-transporting ATPase KdpC subunit